MQIKVVFSASMKRKFLVAIFFYLFLAFVAGLFDYWDPRGPKIYPAELHVALHHLGRLCVGKDKSYAPIYERTWFYGKPSVKYPVFRKGSKTD